MLDPRGQGDQDREPDGLRGARSCHSRLRTILVDTIRDEGGRDPYRTGLFGHPLLRAAPGPSRERIRLRLRPAHREALAAPARPPSPRAPRGHAGPIRSFDDRARARRARPRRPGDPELGTGRRARGAGGDRRDHRPPDPRRQRERILDHHRHVGHVAHRPRPSAGQQPKPHPPGEVAIKVYNASDVQGAGQQLTRQAQDLRVQHAAARPP